jgi:hypothetical protein
MNLQLLKNGTPDEKKWLDIVCYDIKCNSITPNVPYVTISNKIESNDLSSSITCNDIGIGGGGMSAIGNIDMNLNLLRNVGTIDTSDPTLNIITPTTQIINGSSEIKMDVDSVDRVVLDNAKSAVYSKNALTGPAGSLLELNNDNTFTLGCYFANNGIIECRPNSLALYGNTATTAITITDTSITSSLGVGGRIDREILDSTSQTFKDGGGVERLRVDNSGVTIGNSYTLPTSDGLANQYIYTNGAGVCSWASPSAINPFNQNLNTSDSVQFVNVNVNGNYTLPSTAGVDGEVLTRSIGSTTVWNRPQVYSIFSQIADKPVVNTAAETSLLGTGTPTSTTTVAAGFFTSGMSFRYTTGGLFRTSANNISIRFRLRNSGVLFDSGLLVFSNRVITPTPWNVETTFTFRAPTTMITNFTFTYNAGNDARGFTSQASNLTFNPLVSNTLDFTAQWTVASADNDITTNFGIIQKIY